MTSEITEPGGKVGEKKKKKEIIEPSSIICSGNIVSERKKMHLLIPATQILGSTVTLSPFLSLQI